MPCITVTLSDTDSHRYEMRLFNSNTSLFKLFLWASTSLSLTED
jgi:hypothetical protein